MFNWVPAETFHHKARQFVKFNKDCLKRYVLVEKVAGIESEGKKRRMDGGGHLRRGPRSADVRACEEDVRRMWGEKC